MRSFSTTRSSWFDFATKKVNFLSPRDANRLPIHNQGLLGGFRVVLDRHLGNNLVLIHGCFAQLVFGMLVILAALTSAPVSQPSSSLGTSSTRLARVSLATCILVYLQIVFGALFRHTYSAWGQRGHLLTAFAVVAATAWIVKETIDLPMRDKRLTLTVSCLAVLVVLQLFLGVEAWMVRMTAMDVAWQAVIRTAHVLVGSLIFAAALGLTYWAYQRLPRGFIPNEDQGYFITIVQAPQGVLVELIQRDR